MPHDSLFHAYIILDRNGDHCGDPYINCDDATQAAKVMNKKFSPFTIKRIRCTYEAPSSLDLKLSIIKSGGK